MLVQPQYMLAPHGTEWIPKELLPVIEARTDQEGRARLPAIDREKLDNVHVIAKEFGTQVQRYVGIKPPVPAERTIRLRP